MWQVIGHENAVELLKRAIDTRSLSHAYLLAGPPHVGKMALALELARALNCPSATPPCGECAACQRIASGGYADVRTISLAAAENGEGKLRAEIGIDQIKEVLHSASLPPFEGRCKVFIIEGAEQMSNEAANCLLKTLEEPLDRVLFILLTTNDRLLPETIISRCQRLELRPVAADCLEESLKSNLGMEQGKAKLLVRLSRGCPGWAISAALDDNLLERRREQVERLVRLLGAGLEERFTSAAQLAASFSQSRTGTFDLLEVWLEYWRDVLLLKAGCADFIASIDRLAELEELAGMYELAQIRLIMRSIQLALERLRLNASPRLVFETLMLEIPVKGRGASLIS